MPFTKKNLSFLFLLTTACYFGCNTSKKAVSTSTSTQTTKSEKMVTGGAITFAAANDRYSANGEFKSWHFTKMNVVTNAASEIETLDASLAIDLSSIWEKSDGLTDHLKAPDFFNIEKYTTATMDIMNVKKQSDGTYTADMKLNMKGLSQDMSSTFSVTSTNPLHVKGTAMVNRNLFSLGSTEMKVPEMVAVTYDTDLPQ
ncbi:MAG: polyisoprenoid-binding protein YceI [Patescibacteria group bacterium]|jgi:polyisoprenoid-binding protein YceI